MAGITWPLIYLRRTLALEPAHRIFVAGIYMIGLALALLVRGTDVVRRQLFLPLIIMPLIAACTTVEPTGEEIAIEHPSNQFAIAEIKADDHCAETGRRAHHVQTSLSQQSVLFFQSSVSVFRCVSPKPVKK